MVEAEGWALVGGGAMMLKWGGRMRLQVGRVWEGLSREA